MLACGGEMGNRHEIGPAVGRNRKGNSYPNRGNYSSLENTHYPNGTCFPGLNRLFVDAEGNFYICKRMTDFPSIGNVFDGFSHELIFKVFDDYCRMCESNGCSECWAIRLCQVCYVGAKHNKGLDLERMKVTCNMIKENLIEDIAFYLQVLDKNERAFSFIDGEITYDRFKNKFVYGKSGIEVK
jgi:radical SAM protein with 4Fe4S-binding SPASM domain